MSTPIKLNQDTLDLLHAIEASQPGSLAGLIRLFVADAPALLSRIELAHERQDANELSHASHYLRSSALALGVEELAAAANEVEHLKPEEFGTEVARKRLSLLRSGLRDAVLALLQHTAEL